MVKGGEVGNIRKFKRRVRSKDEGSDDSDEDYVVSLEGNEESEDDAEYCCSSLDECASEEGFKSFIDDEEEEKGARKGVRSKHKQISSARTKKIVGRKSRKRKFVSDEEDDEEEEVRKVVRSKDTRMSSAGTRKIVHRKSRKQKSISDEEDDDEDYEEEEEEMRKIVDRKSKKRKGISDDEDYKGEEEEEMRKIVDRKSQKWKGISDEDDDEDYKEDGEETRKIVDRKSQKRKGISDEEDDDGDCKEEEEMRKIVDRKSQKWKGVSDAEDDDEDFKEEKEEMRKIVDRKSQKRKGVSDEDDDDEDYKEVEEEEEEEDDDLEYILDEEDDVEFTLDDEDCSDEEEELTMKRKKNNKNISKQGLQKKVPSNHKQKRKKSAVSKKPLRKGGNKKRRLKRKRAYVIHSDSDFVSSGSSDHEFTISEEEREQVKEASRLCGSLKTNLRSSSSTKGIQEVQELGQCKKPPAKKGKEKVEETKAEVIKPICGICLSEEDKRRLRGKLNCCSHYFCFTCIMEWSKVESRCPLCKQRFETISKPARSTAGADLRDVVIQVPKRDQVYQPSEEELRSYLDPYENVICSECDQGGDDELMLLCDICDSSAHTYCVGLGREVPEGNWYCYGCRPVALGSSSSQVQDSLPDQRIINNFYNRFSPVVNLGESLDSITVPSPRTSFPPGFVGLSSPRFPVVDMSPVSPVSGMGAQTLTGRRWLHRQIQNLRSFNRMNLMAGMTDGISTANMGIDLINSHIDQSRQSTVQQARTQHIGTQHQTVFTEWFQDDPSSSLQSRDFSTPRFGHLRRQPVQGSTTRTLNTSVNMTLWPQHAGINLNEQLYQCSNGSNIGPAVFGTPFSVRNDDNYSMAKEQLQVMVRSQLKALSNDADLDNGTFTDIATSSMHTLLATCGLEHRRDEVHIVPPPSNCTHIERVAAGQVSLMKGCCLTCFDSFVKDVVKRIMDTRSRQWLSLGL